MKKLALLWVLLLVLCTGCTPTAGVKPTATAEPIVYESGDYEYILQEDSTAEITYYNGYSATLTIPAELDRHRVTAIGKSVFDGCSNLKSVTIPDSVTSIDSNPFRGCNKLTDINVSADHPTLTTINGVLFEKIEKRLICHPRAFDAKEYVIPQGTRSIGNEAFSDCSLTSVIIPDSVTSIGEMAFGYCKYLTSVVIPDSVTSIGQGAFAFCSSLTSVTIPDSVTFIGANTFSICDSLTSIIIPDSVTSIGRGAFSNCFRLTSVTIPDSVISIGGSAFYDCDYLKHVAIPDGVTSIGSDAFFGCDALTLTVSPGSYAEQYAIDNDLRYTH